MAERRKSRKRNAGPPRESKRLSLLDLPPKLDPRDEQPTNPKIAIQQAERTTLLPAPDEPLADTSLASLAQAAHRASGAPVAPKKLPHALYRREGVAQAPAAPSTEPSPPPDFARPSSLPPPIPMPSEPPRARAPGAGNPWLRTLGVIVLSSSVGAAVSSLISGAKGELEQARSERKIESVRVAGTASAPTCVTAAALAIPEPNPQTTILSQSAVADRRSAADAPRISIDTLPLQAGRRRADTVETISLETRAHASREAKSESKRSRPASPPETLPVQPSRAAVSQAMGRAASAATACDSGPQDGKVTVTFAPSGAVQSVSLVKGFGDATLNGCVLRAFGRARVQAFSGDPVQVRKTIAW